MDEIEEKKTKKGQIGINAIPAIALSLVLGGLVVGFGALILGNIEDGMTAASTEALAVGNATEGLGNMAEQFPNIGLIAAAVVIIGLLVIGFGKFSGGGR